VVPRGNDVTYEGVITDAEHIRAHDYMVKVDLDVADTDDVTTLRNQLDQKQSANSIAVRLDHAQSQMDTLAAYIDSLEEFLDEERAAQQLLENL